MSWIEQAARWIEVGGVLVILGGGLAATALFVWGLVRNGGFLAHYHAFRANLGRAIILGLEFLVAGDIIATILVRHSLESVGALAIVVMIRTFLSFSLETEIEGRFPWQGADEVARTHGAREARSG